jgi:hypothetical protein
MSPADGIRKLGFRRWYERQLIESHAYFLTCFLCMIMVLACLEGFSFRAAGWRPVAMLALIVGGAAIGLAALKRYNSLLNRAEYIAEHSTCGQCSTYGRLQILGSGGDSEPNVATGSFWIKVQCRKCGNQWLIE